MHQHTHSHDHAQNGVRNLQVAFLLNLLFTIIEIGGGIWSNSVAILSDAVHDAGDCLSLGMAWYLHQMSLRRADARFTYGYRRLSLLGALLTGIVLSGGLGFVIWESVSRLGNPEQVNAPGVIGIAALGVILNAAAAWRLHGGQSLNETLAGWHLLEDTLGWAAVLVGGIVMAIADVPIVDPIIAILISALVLWNVVRNLRRVALVFLQAAPHGFDSEEFNATLMALPHVIDAHHTHTWSLDGERHVFSTHLVLQPSSDREQILNVKQQVHDLLRKHAFEHITVEIELAGERCAAGFEPPVDSSVPDHTRESSQTGQPDEAAPAAQRPVSRQSESRPDT